MSQHLISAAAESRSPLWPRDAVPVTVPNERRFTASFADFARQAKGWGFVRGFGIGFGSAFFLFAQGVQGITL
jgi:hypothetical protein